MKLSSMTLGEFFKIVEDTPEDDLPELWLANEEFGVLCLSAFQEVKLTKIFERPEIVFTSEKEAEAHLKQQGGK